MDPATELLRFDQLQPTRWRNDGGWTREIARGGTGDDWLWRLSLAEVESDGAFSRFEGVEREIVLLSGAGMTLDFGGGLDVALDAASPRWHFSGESAVDCRLHAGPTRDFNLMWRRGLVDAELWLKEHAGESTQFAAAGETWALHLVAGAGRLPDAGDADFLPGDTLLMHDDGSRRSHRIVMDGRLIAVRLRTLPPG